MVTMREGDVTVRVVVGVLWVIVDMGMEHQLTGGATIPAIPNLRLLRGGLVREG
jgi:hypothetical protein